MSYVATHDIDDRPVNDQKTGKRLFPHLVKVGRHTEHDAMTKHQLFERVPISMARDKKVSPFVRSRLVAVEVLRIKNKRGGNSRVLALRHQRKGVSLYAV